MSSAIDMIDKVIDLAESSKRNCHNLEVFRAEIVYYLKLIQVESNEQQKRIEQLEEENADIKKHLPMKERFTALAN